MKKRTMLTVAGIVSIALLVGCSSDKSAATKLVGSAPAAVTPPKAESDPNPFDPAPKDNNAAVPAVSKAAEAEKPAPSANNDPPAKAQTPKASADSKPAPPPVQEQTRAPAQAPEAKKPASPPPKAEPPVQAPASGATSKPEQNPPAPAKPEEKAPAVADATAKAEPLFKSNCMVCHGEQLQGGMGPNISKVGERRTKEQLIDKITGGGKVMPAFKDTLKPEEIETLAAWLATKK